MRSIEFSVWIEGCVWSIILFFSSDLISVSLFLNCKNQAQCCSSLTVHAESSQHFCPLRTRHPCSRTTRVQIDWESCSQESIWGFRWFPDLDRRTSIFRLWGLAEPPIKIIIRNIAVFNASTLDQLGMASSSVSGRAKCSPWSLSQGLVVTLWDTRSES